MSNGGGIPLYHLKNCSLVRFFTKLDPIRGDLILKSNIQLP